MMFTLLSPQKARHAEGYIVQIADRHSVEYFGDGRIVVASVDFGATVGLYAATLKDGIGGSVRLPMGPDQRMEIVNRLKAGLEAMGSQVEIL